MKTAFKNILTVIITMLCFSACYVSGIERIPIEERETYTKNEYAETYWKGDSMQLYFYNNTGGRIFNHAKSLLIDTIDFTYKIELQHVGMICKDKYKDKNNIGINVTDGKLLSPDTISLIFELYLTNEKNVDTINYKELFIKQY